MKQVEEKEQFVKPVKLTSHPLSYSQVIDELRSIFQEQRDIDKHVFKEMLEKSRFKTSNFLEQNPVTYTCELLREILLHTLDQEQDKKVKELNKKIANKSVDYIKDIFLNINFEHKKETMYVFFAYVIGMLDNLDLRK